MENYTALTKEQCTSIEDQVLKTWEGRANAQGYKGKKRQDLQAEFLLGMTAALDVINDAEKTGQSSISPRLFFSIMRGDYVK